MECKNCHQSLLNSANFCPNCGAKIVTERVSLKTIWQNFAADFFGWDNKFLFTFKSLLLRPHIIIKEYLDGTRKKYLSPFTFLAICTAISLLTMSLFEEQYLELMNTLSDSQAELMDAQIEDVENQKIIEQQRQQQQKMNEMVNTFMLKHYNLTTFFLIPIYALMAFWVFGKPFNYGEHLVTGCYLQGFLLIIATLFLTASIFVHTVFFNGLFLSSMGYYLFAYGRLYNLSFGKLMLKLLKFIGIAVLFFILSYLLGYTIGELT